MQRMFKGLLAVLLLQSLGGADAARPLLAEEVQPRIDQRFAAESAEVPDFQKHVIPMLSKLGCNGRACHGSFQGRGGFMLSLFGYDFKMDHKGLYERLDVDDPADSYALQKALTEIEHEGGQRILPESWEHRVFLSWIQAGAQGLEQEARLEKLEISPKELQFANAGETAQLRVIAHWQNGVREDVTPLCRFQTNDAAIAEISEQGLVTAGSPGDTHVVVFYDNGTVPIPVLRPVSDRTGDRYPSVAAPTRVDELVVGKLSKLGIIPAETCSDTEFLRRVTLDIAGTLPSPAEIEAFLADGSADKRSRKIDELLETPAYTAWWATRLSDYTGNTSNQLNNVSFNQVQPNQEWYEWLRKRVADNVPYDQIVEGIVLAGSQREDETYEEYSARMTEYFKDRTGQKFAEQDSLPYFWARRNFQRPEDRAIGFAYTFLAVRIECAQCHKHPFDQWTQDDFKEFQPLFSTTRFSQNGTDRREYQRMLAELKVDDELRGNQLRRELTRMLQQGKVVPFPAIIQTSVGGGPRRGPSGRQRTVNARMLGGEPFDLSEHADPRVPLMAWLRGDARELFAKAFVNRVWSNYFHRGIVEPTDDLNLANPPANEELLNHLTQGFLDNNYDMKWLHREICNSRTYQLSVQPNETNRLDERNFSRAIPRRMQAEIAYDALAQATASGSRNAEYLHNLRERATAIPGTAQGRGNANNYALTIFGKSPRENNCDCDRSNEPTLLQTLFMYNDNEVLSALDNRNGWLAEVAREWNQPLVSNPNAEPVQQPRRPDNFDEQVARMRAQIERARTQGDQERARVMRMRLRAYLERVNGPAAAAANQDRPRRQNTDDNQNATAKRGEAKPTLEMRQQAISEAYLRTVSRLPSEAEQATALQALTAAETPLEGLRDVVWALLNTKEFILNH